MVCWEAYFMERTLIADLNTKVGQEVTIKGWISVRRDQGKMVFFDFRDRSGFVQGVVLPKSEAIEVAKDIRNEFVVSVVGLVNKRPEKNINTGVQNGDIELEVKQIEVLSKAESLPFDMSLDGYNLDLPTELDHRALALRHPRLQAIFKVQAVIVDSFREFMKSQDFLSFKLLPLCLLPPRVEQRCLRLNISTKKHTFRSRHNFTSK